MCCPHPLTIVTHSTGTIRSTRTRTHRETHLLIAHNDCKVKRITLLLCEERRRREGWRPHKLIRTQRQIPSNQLLIKFKLSTPGGSNSYFQFIWLLSIESDIKLIIADQESVWFSNQCNLRFFTWAMLTMVQIRSIFEKLLHLMRYWTPWSFSLQLLALDSSPLLEHSARAHLLILLIKNILRLFDWVMRYFGHKNAVTLRKTAKTSEKRLNFRLK